MKKARVEGRIDCDVAQFWKLFVDRRFNEALFLEGLGFRAFEILEMSADVRKVRCTPSVSLPGPLQKLLGDNLSYVEDCRRDPASGVWRWEVTPSSLAGKIRNTGRVSATPLAEGRCTRIDEMEIEANVFGLGGLIESSTEKQVVDAWKKTTEFTNRWLLTDGSR